MAKISMRRLVKL